MKNPKALKIGLDIHGVIDQQREFFSALTKVLVECNEKLGHQHEIHVLTGPKWEHLKPDDLTDIAYTHFFSIVSHNEEAGTPMRWTKGPNNEDFAWINEDSWNRTKGEYCAKHGIDIMLDDSDVYHEHFLTPYARFYHKKS